MENECGKQVELPGIPLKLSMPAKRALANAGITTMRQLAKRTRSEVAALHGMGPKGVRELEEGLRERGLAFAKK